MAGVEAIKPPASGSHNKAIPMPRQLRETESFQDITAWDVSLRNFYRKDEVFYPFVNAKMKWDSSKEDYNLRNEHEESKLKREKDELAQDLIGFLQIVAGYVPGDHLRLTILKDTKCYEDVIRIIREFYDAEVGVETELDFMKIEPKAQEPHRMFYERLSAHVREHLVPANKSVGTTSSGENGDIMTLSLQNMVAKVFLHKVNPKLANIIKKEYGPVLKSGKLLCELIPEICRNIDNLLERDRNQGSVNLVQNGAASIKQVSSELPEDLSEMTLEEIDAHEEDSVNTIKKMYHNARNKKRGGYSRRGGGGNFSGPDRRGQSKCHHCDYANKAHNLALDTFHPPFKCPNKKAVARMIVADDEGEFEPEFLDGKPVYSEASLIQSIQSDQRERRVPVLPDEYEDYPVIRFINIPLKYSQKYDLTDLSHSDTRSLEGRVRKIVRKRSKIRKEKSPAVEAIVNGKKFVITIDEGAELNIISADLVRRANIPTTFTSESANAADGGGLKVIGQTLFELKVYALFQGTRVEVNLGNTLVVENLEADILMGEPDKKDNMVQTTALTQVLPDASP